MCGSKPKVDNSALKFSKKEAARAREEEAAREARIAEGMSQISAIFDGGRAYKTTAAKGAYDPASKYFLADGSRWSPDPKATVKETITTKAPARATPPAVVSPASLSPTNSPVGVRPEWMQPGSVAPLNAYPGGRPEWMMPGVAGAGATAGVGVDPVYSFGNGTTTKTVKRALTPEEQFAAALEGLSVRQQGKQHAGMQPLLDARRAAQESFYYPQLAKNRSNAEDELTFALSRAGLSTSTVANKKATDLAEGFNLEKAGLAADIDADVAGARTGLNQQRLSLESQLRASGDASAATNAALAARGAFAQDAPKLDTLANTLLAFSDGIGSAREGYDAGRIRSIARGGSTVNRDTSRVIS